MDKVAYFKITRLKISRFKLHVDETEYHFGDLTMISGGNHTGKTTIADAIVWAMIGQGFFGGHLLDRFYNDKNREKRIAVELEYVDASGIRHVLSRQRINDKVDAALDGSVIRQKDLNAMFGDADEFLSLVNPLYFIEILAEKGRGLLERNLPSVETGRSLSKAEQRLAESAGRLLFPVSGGGSVQPARRTAGASRCHDGTEWPIRPAGTAKSGVSRPYPGASDGNQSSFRADCRAGSQTEN